MFGMNDFEPVRDATTPNEMRAEIMRLSWNNRNPLVRQVMDAADYNGLSAEDRYTLLAYHALKEMTRLQRLVHEHVLITPFPFSVKRAKQGKTD